MNIASGILFATLSLAALTGYSQTGVTSPDMKETKRYKPADSVRNYNGGYNKLFAFVGEMITVDQLPYQPGEFDESFKAKYRILQKVYGKFEGDTIEFLVFDHYGRPPFTRYKNVLLYVFADSGTYVHEKYM
ncbi:hypothetical protein [Pseudobacter ginsenosidimutans]|uniref:Uncharacterized protein n=1 Tax=Pseudobacter ginsenosidimutans TaxID=661488 RepID=A0A4Q7N570_9BACT|nr:hypothetical protein [Pseudobacter ginsenosidimutans]QEC44704.1 hypothetical protein FSB84_24590 [Pseudobacter ginsenosidimutans]RZS76185.1 hypothetical protein EV199_2064 [Pseudobacter ginsenosidimutans]